MKLKNLALILVALAACSSRHLMNAENFSQIKNGTAVKDVEAQYGQPANTYKNGPQTIYEYIERVNMGTQTVQLKRYYLVTKDGKVTSKYVRYTNQPGFSQIDSDNPFPDQTGEPD